MIRHFRINDPYRLISLLILLILASIPFVTDMPLPTQQELKGFILGESMGDKLMYVELIDKTPPLMVVADGVLDFLFGRSLMARHILALLFIFFQASYFGVLLINNKAYNDSNYLPSLIFGFLCFFSFDLLAITPELLASGLLLLALNNLFKEIEFRIDRDSIVLNLGFFLGMASLFVFSYTIFLFGSVFILIIFARASFRKILLLFFGYGMVHGILLIYYYCFERTDELWANFYIPNATHWGTSLVSSGSLLMLGILPVIYFVSSLFMLTREARFTRYQSQLFQVMFIWLVVSIVQMGITPELTPHSFFTFIPPLSYFISHYLLLINRKWIAEIMLWIFMIGILSINLLSMKNIIQSVDYTNLFPSSRHNEIAGKRVMMLGDDLSIYRENKLAGYFLNWELSKKYFAEPDYYVNISKINQSFLKDPPDVIIDDESLMEDVLERIPALKRAYRKEGNRYFKR